jgi:hypothetical protein
MTVAEKWAIRSLIVFGSMVWLLQLSYAWQAGTIFLGLSFLHDVFAAVFAFGWPVLGIMYAKAIP